MATVTSQLTRIHDVEGALTLTSISGGAGAVANTEIFIQGAQSAGRRQSNVTDHGFWLQATSRDISAAGVHVGIWIQHIHYAVLTKFAMRLGSTTANYHEHVFPLASWPKAGGWVRAWINVARTPEAQAGTFDKAALTQVAVLASLPAVGGNAPNLIMDASDFTTGGLLLTGTGGVFNDFIAADEDNGTNKYGVVLTRSGVMFCLGRMTLGSASSLVFSDSSFVIIFPDQSLVASNFMGISVDLQAVGTDIDWANAVVRSAGATRGDLVVTGSTGTFNVVDSTFSKLRLVTLTSICVVTSSSFDDCGVITAPGSTLTNTKVSGYAGTADTSALVWDANTDPDGKLNGMTFTKGSSSAHAIEFGTTSPLTMTLTNVTFSGYNAANGATDSAIHVKRTTGTVTINITGGTTPSYKSDGATVNIVANPVTVTVTTKDINGDPVGSANVFLKAASGGSGILPVSAAVTSITRINATTAEATHAAVHNMSTGDKVYIRGANQAAYNGVFTITLVGVASPTTMYRYTTLSDPGVNATGTLIATFVFLKDTTNASGVLSMSRVISADQNVTGWARKHSTPPSYTPPNYKTSNITGIVLSSVNFSATVLLISDD